MLSFRAGRTCLLFRPHDCEAVGRGRCPAGQPPARDWVSTRPAWSDSASGPLSPQSDPCACAAAADFYAYSSSTVALWPAQKRLKCQQPGWSSARADLLGCCAHRHLPAIRVPAPDNRRSTTTSRERTRSDSRASRRGRRNRRLPRLRRWDAWLLYTADDDQRQERAHWSTHELHQSIQRARVLAPAALSSRLSSTRSAANQIGC